MGLGGAGRGAGPHLPGGAQVSEGRPLIGQCSRYSLLIGQDAVREEAGAGGEESGAKEEKQEKILTQTGSQSRTAKRFVTTATC